MTSRSRDRDIDMLSTEQVAELLAVSEKTVIRYARSGKLPQPIRLGKFNRWRRADLEAWMRQVI